MTQTMPHLITLIIGIAVIACTRRLYYRNFELFLCVLIPVNFDFFHLVPRIGQFDIYREILLVVVIFYFVEEIFMRRLLAGRNVMGTRLGKYGTLVVFYLFLVFLGAVISFANGQGINFGLKAIKWYPTILIFFIVAKKGINLEKFYKYFLWLASIVAILLLLQYLAYEKINIFYDYEDTITHVRGINSIRGLRILEGDTVINIGLLIACSLFIKHKKPILLLNISLLLFVILAVIKTRMEIAAIMVTLVFIYLSYKGLPLQKMIRAVCLVWLLFILFLLLPAINPALVTKNKFVAETVYDIQGTSSFHAHGSLYIRLLTYEYYWAQVKQRWLIGRGVQNPNWQGNDDSYVIKRHNFHLADIGMFHLVVNHGLLGLLFLGVLFFKLVPDCFFGNKNYEITSYFMLGFFMMPTIDLFFRPDRIFIFGIFLALLNIDYYNIPIRKIGSEGNINYQGCQ